MHEYQKAFVLIFSRFSAVVSSKNHHSPVSNRSVRVEMADPGEPAEAVAVERVAVAAAAAFLKCPQVPIVQMTELHLCAHDHSFVPPW